MRTPAFIALAFAALSLAACGGSDTDRPDPVLPTQVERGPDARFAMLPEPYASADYALGRRTWRMCSSCHLVEPDAGNLMGPNLHAMFSREVGSLPGYRYSSALDEADFTWTPEALEAWLADPRGFLPGNKMTFAGLSRDADRQAVTAYLMTLSGWEAEP